ncbi:hypothetical protein [Burkholderia territorii]|uniref:hypothetical protein n=1 Tax=Burkholderia territorii TaxID=1503055 RepID=UPI0039BEE656
MAREIFDRAVALDRDTPALETLQAEDHRGVAACHRRQPTDEVRHADERAVAETVVHQFSPHAREQIDTARFERLVGVPPLRTGHGLKRQPADPGNCIEIARDQASMLAVTQVFDRMPVGFHCDVDDRMRLDPLQFFVGERRLRAFGLGRRGGRPDEHGHEQYAAKQPPDGGVDGEPGFHRGQCDSSVV